MTRAQLSKFAIEAQLEKGINTELSYGLGFDLVVVPYYSSSGVHVIGKGGDSQDYHSMMLCAPDQRISVAVIEASGSNAAKIAFDTLNAVLQQKGIIQKDATPEVTPTTIQPIPTTYSAFEGYYAPRYKISFDYQSNVCVVTTISDEGATYSITLSYQNGDFYLDGIKMCFITVNGCNYLLANIWNNMVYMVYAEQVPTLDNPQSLSVDVNGVVWLRRNVAPFESMSFAPPHILVSAVVSDLPGYVVFSGFKKVESPTYASVPTASVRDQTELNLINKDEQVWAQIYDALYYPSSLAAPLNKGTSTVTISADGYCQWGFLTQDSVLSFQKPTGDQVWSTQRLVI
jgi:hypothetical protein